MGNSEKRPVKQEQTMEDAILDMKMTSKKLEFESNRAEKDSKKGSTLISRTGKSTESPREKRRSGQQTVPLELRDAATVETTAALDEPQNTGAEHPDKVLDLKRHNLEPEQDHALPLEDERGAGHLVPTEHHEPVPEADGHARRQPESNPIQIRS